MGVGRVLGSRSLLLGRALAKQEPWDGLTFGFRPVRAADPVPCLECGPQGLGGGRGGFSQALP